MTEPKKPEALFELPPQRQAGDSDPSQRPTALVHILTPEFHGLDPDDFAHIPEDVVARASATELRENLHWRYRRVGQRLPDEEELSSMSYMTPDEGVRSVALTPEELDTMSESLGKLAQRVFNRVLTQRDAKLREETDDKNARARGEEDLKAANRGAVRAVMGQQADMEKLLESSVVPKIELIEKFIEMTQGKNPNLARGNRATVSERFETLRSTVFEDMLDAVALTRKWSPDMVARAKQVIQKRLYISGTPSERVANFQEMLTLAHEYYGYKRALILTKIQDAKKFQRQRPEVVADILAVNEQRRKEKEAKQQLPFDEAE